ncbi:HAMP domain-containing protein [Pontibacter sp. KCTC 32443]|uniref:HAMP domain-containing sensor histidine kinase n=1 Tax=Pontibacter TaxID=323449 RepID=UPI00164DC76F|nr:MULTISPECIES: ATP-binding protein [Pontibacter]MBC5772894.1 HAMP domain-containing protein [Pontibacter sp. KCTC 32443]
MKIRNRLTLQFAGIFTLILVLFSLVIYYFTSIYRQEDFYDRILQRAKVVSAYVFDADEADARTRRLNQIRFYQVLPYEVVKIYDSQGRQTFTEGRGRLEVDNALLTKIRQEKELHYEQGDRQVVGIVYHDNQGEFIVLASSIDAYSLKKLQHLKVILIVGFLGSLIVVLVAGWVFAKEALRPITKVVSEVEKITASDLHMRLSNADGKDELSHLAQTFNKMLERLELAFEMQSTFVSNASHELRTPLTTMMGELEVALMKPRTPEEYQRVLNSTLEDARLLTELSNGLLQIAQASIDSSKIQQVYLRFDELVWMARDQVVKRQPNAHIDIDFADFPDEEDRLVVKGNEALLLIAMVNVIENAIKFSPTGRSATVRIVLSRKDVKLVVTDRGLGITEEDLKHVFVPFFRAENVRNITGHGIGLPLTERILKLHNGSITVHSQINQGTEVTLTLPQAYGFIPARP